MASPHGVVCGAETVPISLGFMQIKPRCHEPFTRESCGRQTTRLTVFLQRDSFDRRQLVKRSLRTMRSAGEWVDPSCFRRFATKRS